MEHLSTRMNSNGPHLKPVLMITLIIVIRSELIPEQKITSYVTTSCATFVRTFLVRHAPPEREQQLLNRYNEETTLGIIAAPEIPGATQFLDFIFGKKHMVLLSATPHDILISLVKERKLERYFEHIQGAPINKADWMKTYIDQSGMKHAVSIGDSKEDALSAQKISLPFIPIGHDIPNAFPNYYNLMQPQLIP